MITIEEVKDLLQQIKNDANEVWILDGRQYIKIQEGKRTVQIMVWFDDGTAALPEPTRALVNRWG